MADSDKNHVKTFTKESLKQTNIFLNPQPEFSLEKSLQHHTI